MRNLSQRIRRLENKSENEVYLVVPVHTGLTIDEAILLRWGSAGPPSHTTKILLDNAALPYCGGPIIYNDWAEKRGTPKFEEAWSRISNFYLTGIKEPPDDDL